MRGEASHQEIDDDQTSHQVEKPKAPTVNMRLHRDIVPQTRTIAGQCGRFLARAGPGARGGEVARPGRSVHFYVNRSMDRSVSIWRL